MTGDCSTSKFHSVPERGEAVADLRAALAAANADLLNIQNAIGFPLLVIDRQMCLARYNAQAMQVFGLEPADVGRPVGILASYRPLLAMLQEPLQRTMAEGKPVEDDLLNDGMIVRLRVVPGLDHLGQTAGAVITCVDETQIHQARLAADQSNHIQAAFLARMSHELRTPLNAILGFTEILRDQPHGPVAPEKQLDYLSVVRESGQHLLALIDDLLDVSRIDGGHLRLRETPVHLCAVLHRVLEALDKDVRAGQLDLGLVECPPSILPLRADEIAVRRVLINVVGNAIKYTPPGGQIRVRLIQEPQWISIVVSDTGVGVHGDDLVRIFEPFHRGRSGRAHTQEGAGLGLSIAKFLMSLHDGEVDFQSTLGIGSVVTIRFPADRQEWSETVSDGGVCSHQWHP